VNYELNVKMKLVIFPKKDMFAKKPYMFINIFVTILAFIKNTFYLCTVLEIILAPLSWERLRPIPQKQRDFLLS